MRAVLQRVTTGSVTVENEVVAQIGLGYVSRLGSVPMTRPRLPGVG